MSVLEKPIVQGFDSTGTISAEGGEHRLRE